MNGYAKAACRNPKVRPENANPGTWMDSAGQRSKAMNARAARRERLMGKIVDAMQPTHGILAYGIAARCMDALEGELDG